MEKRRIITRKPERGSFLLDHNNECTLIKNKYLKCLNENNSDHILCRDYSKEYFLCRMEHNLLEKQNLENLGFFENEINTPINTSRINGFKDVYSYNKYNENLEEFAKKKYVPTNLKEDTKIYSNHMEEKNKEGCESLKDDKFFNKKNSNILEKAAEDLKKIEKKEKRKNEKEKKKSTTAMESGNTFILLNISQNKQTSSIISHTETDEKKEQKKKKIEIKRKEVDGYLAGKEYIKMLAEKKNGKRNKIGVFIDNLFYGDKKKNSIF